MFVKASIAATALICAVVSLSSIDFRELYNGMYPVNGLRRDVLNLCHEAEPTFVRAIGASRDNCYDSMPDPVELAIGWVRTSSRLAAMRRPPTPVELAEHLLVDATAQRRFDLLGPRRFTGYAAMPAAAGRPCDEPANGLAATAPAQPSGSLASGSLATDPLATDPLANDRLARHIAAGEDTAIAALGLAPRDARPAPASAVSAGAAGGSALFDPTPAAGLGDSSGLSLAPRAAAPRCKTPA